MDAHWHDKSEEIRLEKVLLLADLKKIVVSEDSWFCVQIQILGHV